MTDLLHVTPDMVQDFIDNVKYVVLSNISVACIITLTNGMEVVGIAQRQTVNTGSLEVAKTVSYSHAYRSTYELAIAHYRAKQ